MRKVPGAWGERWGTPVSPAGVPEAPIIEQEREAGAGDLVPTALLTKEQPEP